MGHEWATMSKRSGRVRSARERMVETMQSVRGGVMLGADAVGKNMHVAPRQTCVFAGTMTAFQFPPGGFSFFCGSHRKPGRQPPKTNASMVEWPPRPDQMRFAYSCAAEACNK